MSSPRDIRAVLHCTAFHAFVNVVVTSLRQAAARGTAPPDLVASQVGILRTLSTYMGQYLTQPWRPTELEDLLNEFGHALNIAMVADHADATTSALLELFRDKAWFAQSYVRPCVDVLERATPPDVPIEARRRTYTRAPAYAWMYEPTPIHGGLWTAVVWNAQRLDVETPPPAVESAVIAEVGKKRKK